MWLAKLQQESRTAERHQVDAEATLRGADDEPADILVADVSATGCLFICEDTLPVGTVVTVGFSGLGKIEARVVRSEGVRHGAAFEKPLDPAILAAALARPRDAVATIPIHFSTSPYVEEVVRPEERWPAPVRLCAVLMMTILGWGLLFAFR